MIVCRKTSDAAAQSRSSTSAQVARPRLGRGGPVFLPRRRISPAAAALLALPYEVDRVTAYDERWFAGRPLTG